MLKPRIKTITYLFKNIMYSKPSVISICFDYNLHSGLQCWGHYNSYIYPKYLVKGVSILTPQISIVVTAIIGASFFFQIAPVSPHHFKCLEHRLVECILSILKKKHVF